MNGSFMDQKHYLQPINLSDTSTIDSLVEHRKVYTLKNLELSIFETFTRCTSVHLSYEGLVITSMMRGKKVMHYGQEPGFDFLPGTSIMIPSGVSMKANFPDADSFNPVQCATLMLHWDVVNACIDRLNEQYSREDGKMWKLDFKNYHFNNNQMLTATLNRLISISMEDDIGKDALADLTLKTLLVRVMQTQSLPSIKENDFHKPDPMLRMEAYIRNHITDKITVEDLAKIATGSKASVFRHFKDVHNTSPINYINHQRIELSKRLMCQPGVNISEVCYQSGFSNVSYFDKVFRFFTGVRPGDFLRQIRER
ncbi:AraC family transcriptional regulator [Sphingobacterium sp. SRCM116780]|uniref:helix-turn-helix domain-containing protein n=1 Tax=Sphingobacterium sp. SRCM116780 TaxID=2907623 RepID=UPI001F32F6BD|nr:helix-turn-helix domain-containing protein [Sphingobacterium sp. SRCM116780]UIR54677.1 AraC family transcriptional regulator [Sphingobacterium sp. SRCM116780]